MVFALVYLFLLAFSVRGFLLLRLSTLSLSFCFLLLKCVQAASSLQTAPLLLFSAPPLLLSFSPLCFLTPVVRQK